MDNYPYIIAGLPDLLLDHDSHPYNFKEIRQQIVESCSAKDRRLIDWFEFGLQQEGLSPHFYREALKHNNLFIRSYFAYDKNLKMAKAAYVDKRPFSGEFEEYSRLKSVFTMTNIFEREKKLDDVTWDKINEIVTYELFNINVILAFLAKAHIVERWNALDQDRGKELFNRLVQEVKGTFKGVEYK
ncbi:MAG: DUF2764 family protein [Bacteroidales bacterium]